MKSWFSWANELDAIFWIVVAILALAIAIFALIVSRSGRSLETKAVLKAIDETRTQLGNVDQRMEQDHRFQANWMLRLLARFGFLEAQDLANDIKRRLKDKTDQSKKEIDP